MSAERSIAEVQQVLASRHPEVNVETLAADVTETLDLLLSEGLVDV